jgi:DNA-binding beta-propeller fold protein YncE
LQDERMNMFALIAVALAATPAASVTPPREEQTIAVPGFADFMVVDGDSVWATNRGRVERWSRQGKLAETAMTRPCGAMAIAAGALWVADCKEGTVNRIDLKTAKLITAIPTGIANPKGELNVVAGAGAVWVASDDAGKIARIDPATNTVIASIAVDPSTYYLAFGLGSLWAVSSVNQSLQQIDPATNQIVKRIKLGKQPGFLAVGEGAVWVQEQGDGTLARIDPATGTVSGRVKVGADLMYGDIDTGGGAVWLRTTADQTFAMIDPQSLAITARLGKPSGSGALRYAGNGVWTTAHDLHSLTWWSLGTAPKG